MTVQVTALGVGLERNGCIFVLEAGLDARNRIVELDKSGDRARDVLPAPYSVGTQVYEYGGGAFTIDSEGRVIFSDGPTNAVCILDLQLSTVTRVLGDPRLRFADFDAHPLISRWVIAVQEDRSDPTPSKVRHSLVLIDVEKGRVNILDDEHDFYANMRFSADGRGVCWLSWDHPYMPFNGAVLRTAHFQSNGSITNKKSLAGRGVSQPQWARDGSLYFLDDRSGFWQIYVLRPPYELPEHVYIKGLEDCCLGSLSFSLGSCSYQFIGDNIVCSYVCHAMSYVAILCPETNSYRTLDLPLVHLHLDGVRRVSENEFLLVGATLSEPTAVYLVVLGMSGSHEIVQLRSSIPTSLPPKIFATAQPFTCPRTQGLFLDGLVHGFLLLPFNPGYVAPSGTLPPLLVYAHGGPTNHSNAGCSLEAQFWTSRGYALLLLNYAGSTGYGKDYRRRLDAAWGIADSADACSAALYLSSNKVVDRRRLGIVGPSAGGYLALKTACDAPDLWAASVSIFGISNTLEFAMTTHKFESHYADTLLFGEHGRVENEKQIHQERSPIHQADRIKAPILLLHGTEDWVVRPEQSLKMGEALQKLGKTANVILFPREGHSYWKGEALSRSLVVQEHWWRKHLVRA
ncbi:hypothetical protein McaMca56_001362 [Microsporum canis]